VICAKMAEPIKMSFGLWARMGPRNHVLDWGPDPLTGRGNFEGKGRPIGTLCHKVCKNGWTDLNDLYVCDAFPGKDVTFGSVVDNTAHLWVKSQKNLHYVSVNRHFAGKLADCCWMAVYRWIAFCRLRVKCFLPEAMLGWAMFTGSVHGL